MQSLSQQEIIVFLIAANSIVVVTVIFIFFIIRIQQKRKLLYRQQLLEKEYKTKEETLLQISRDLHDDIGSSLSGINLFARMAGEQMKQHNLPAAEENIEKAGNYAAQVIEKVSDMAWLLKPSSESLAILTSKLKSYTIALASSTDIQFHFESPPTSSGLDLDIRHRKAIYLISKEAINNAVKYAECRNIFYKIQLEGENFHLYIRDDGKGFSISENTNGNGLQNIRSRADEINAKISIRSAPGEGTIVELKI